MLPLARRPVDEHHLHKCTPPDTLSSEPGVFVSPDGALSLHVPIGALDAPLELELSRLRVAPRGAVAAWELGPEGTVFAQPVELEVALGAISLPVGVDTAGPSNHAREATREQRLGHGLVWKRALQPPRWIHAEGTRTHARGPRQGTRRVSALATHRATRALGASFSATEKGRTRAVVMHSPHLRPAANGVGKRERLSPSASPNGPSPCPKAG